jgi:phosphate transport system substrate-binding protein
MTEEEGAAMTSKSGIRTKWYRAAGAVAALTFVLAACSDDDPEDTTDTDNSGSETEDDPAEDSAEDLSGNVLIDGSSTVFPLSSAAAELFMGANNGVEVSVASSGTGGGFEKFCNGETDISDASRPIGDDEIAACGDADIAFEQLVVANDALSVLVNPQNPIDCLTVEQLAAIWAPDSTISSWNEIPGLEDAGFDESLDLYGPGTDSGTFDYFTDVINGEEGAQRTDYNNIGENDNNGLTGVQSSLGGLFYVGYSYFAENADTVKALEIDGGNGCVAPSEDTAQDGSYTPLARGLFIYPSDLALQRSEVQEFISFYIDNNDEIAAAALAIPMTEEQKETARAQVESLMGG